uniref:3Beta_HSD domain-containing protein n=1 Tax=Caenorhabditis tropicalis TaxID=1561998 RepID=A0A1I7T7H9_9PELO
MRVTILGSTLTARHFVKYLGSCHQSVQISLWTFDKVQYSEFDNVSTCLRYSGIKNLPNALLAADVVINLHECTDFSLLPDNAKLQLHNVEVVRSILFHCNSPIIHLSTPFLQCSHRWPNVYEPERDPVVFKPQWPFPEYCASKYEAEKLVRASSNDCYIVRSVPTYGEGDECSILTDLIYFSNDKLVVSLGDDDGHMQMAYAGNISVAIWSAVCRLLSQSTSLDLNESFDDELGDLLISAENSFRLHEATEKNVEEYKPLLDVIKEEDENLEGYRARHNTVRTSFDDDYEIKKDDKMIIIGDSEVFSNNETTFQGFQAALETVSVQNLEFSILKDVALANDKKRVFEIFLINDETPKKTVYNTYSQLLFNNKRLRSATQLSFIPLYYIYLLFSMVIQFAIKLLGPMKFATMLPNPSFLYFYFHHWTFFNSTKSLLMLGYKPDLEFNECISKCAKHYREFRKNDVRLFSWQNSMTKDKNTSDTHMCVR